MLRASQLGGQMIEVGMAVIQGLHIGAKQCNAAVMWQLGNIRDRKSGFYLLVSPLFTAFTRLRSRIKVRNAKPLSLADHDHHFLRRLRMATADETTKYKFPSCLTQQREEGGKAGRSHLGER